MKLFFLIALVCGVSAIWTTPQTIPRSTVNLDLAPEDRYTDLINYIVDTYGWEGSYAHVENYWDTLPKAVQDYIEFMSMNLEAYMPQEYAREILGISEVVVSLGHGQDFPLQEVVALNFLYEWTTACTSIIAMDGKGQMWHARNMDWNFGGNSLFNMSYVIDFQTGGQTLFTGVQWIGYIGVLSGANKAFTVTVDQREHYEEGLIWGNLDALEAGAESVAITLRMALEQNMTWSDGLNDLANAFIAAPVYYNMGGAVSGQGSVITRDRNGNTTDIWKWDSGPQPCCPDIQNWYLVETNWDHWTTDGDDRQEDAIASLNALGQNNVNSTTLFNILATPDVLNSNTQYSMVVLNGGSYFSAVGWQ